MRFPPKEQTYQVSIQTVETVSGVWVMIWPRALGANKLHDLMFSLTWSLWGWRTQREMKKLHCGSTTCSWVTAPTCWKWAATHLVTRQVDPDVLPQLVGGELVVDKILQLLLQPDHEISAWKKDSCFSWYKVSSENTSNIPSYCIQSNWNKKILTQ